ncbi:MAG: gamma-glutamyl-gamma-aminobutyrate hydrolase family protein [Clostridium sp.]|uniref:gamma-glutamyl-gamma-aminobutyrate hydrolase family protein n=1 Tax=Clostridium sp. TaxID=1506 RepID=UPI003D6D5DF9
MSKKPIIGISGSLIIDQGGNFPGYERSYVNDDYVQSVANAGGTPFIIPMVYDENVLISQIEVIDALILSGGHDVNPLLYGEEPIQNLGGILPKRDTFDIKLVKIALEMNKPILGICRGEQILNVAGGGSLHQDLSYIDGCFIKHNQGSLPSVATHTVQILEGTKLHEILGDTVMTNSFHHLAIKEVAPGYKISAISKDGVIEAIEKEGGGFILGVQWHPEMMAKDHPVMLKIFKKLIDKAKVKRE